MSHILTDTEATQLTRISHQYGGDAFPNNEFWEPDGSVLAVRFQDDDPSLFVSFVLAVADENRNLAEHLKQCWSTVSVPGTITYTFPNIVFDSEDDYADDEWLLEADDDDDPF